MYRSVRLKKPSEERCSAKSLSLKFNRIAVETCMDHHQAVLASDAIADRGMRMKFTFSSRAIAPLTIAGLALATAVLVAVAPGQAQAREAPHVVCFRLAEG
ncbi:MULTISPECIES: hypothetical protein [unclassified Brevundimonas]|uniref:hypothetical protein n=1 Tax=unclassified Brevundimonas TaxID=2622653 RepID=UPI0025B7B5D3|nr:MULTISPECIES: hypothetical protein [unclassified Brevundimonas]